MNHLEIKVRKMVMELLNQDDFVTLEVLAKKYGVTKRSVQNHIQWLENWFKENNFTDAEIVKKTNKGVRLLLGQESKANVKKLLVYEGLNSFDDIERKMHILRLLLFTDEELTIGFLADFFYVSRSIILKDMDWIGTWLRKSNLQLYKIQNKGIGILGDEISKRNAIALFFDIYKTDSRGVSERSKSLSSRLTEMHFMNLHSLYPNIDTVAIVTLIEEIEQRFDFFLTEEYFVSLLTHITISVARLKTGNKTDEFCLPPDEYEPVREAAEFVSAKISSMFNIAFPDTEIAYICLHLMSYNMRIATKDVRQNFESSENVEALAINIIELVQEEVGGSFSSDKVLYFGILCHLQDLVYCFKNRIHISTVHHEHTIGLDMNIFSAIEKTKDLFADVFGEGFLLLESEMEALTAHFMTSSSRVNRKVRAVLLSSSGILAGIALKDFLTNEIETIEIIDLVTFAFQLDLIPSNTYDFVISSIPLDNVPKPHVCLTYQEKGEYKKHISDFLAKFLVGAV